MRLLRLAGNEPATEKRRLPELASQFRSNGGFMDVAPGIVPGSAGRDFSRRDGWHPLNASTSLPPVNANVPVSARRRASSSSLLQQPPPLTRRGSLKLSEPTVPTSTRPRRPSNFPPDGVSGRARQHPASDDGPVFLDVLEDVLPVPSPKAEMIVRRAADRSTPVRAASDATVSQPISQAARLIPHTQLPSQPPSRPLPFERSGSQLAPIPGTPKPEARSPRPPRRRQTVPPTAHDGAVGMADLRSVPRSSSARGHLDVAIERRQMAQKNWRLAIRAIRALIRATSVFRIGVIASQSPAGYADEVNKLRFARPADYFAHSQIHQLLSKPRTLRTQADFLIVEPHLLKLLPCLSRFTSTHRKLFFLSSLTYETHAPRTMVSKDGGTAESVYFLLSGNVEFYKTQRGVRFKQNLLNPGEMFGDVSSTSLLSEIGRKRTFNVICINFCEFLRLDLDDYVRIVFAHDGSSIDTLVVLLNSLPIFGNSYETTLFNAARASMLCSLSAGEVILEEDEPSDRLFFLCKGKLRAVKTVSFLRSYTVGTGEGMPVPVVRPYQAGEALQFGEEVFEKELPVCDIEVGAAFPQLYLPEFLVLDPTRPRRANFWPRDLQGGSQNSVSGSDEGLSWLAPRTNIKVYAVTSVQLAAFPVKPFLKLATNEMMEQILGQMRSFDIDTRDLQERYMNSLRTLRGAISSGSNGESVTLLGETGEVEFDR